MKLEVSHFADLDADIVHNPQTTDALDQFFLLERVGRAGHDMHLHSAHLSPHQVLNDDGILVALILQEQ